MTTEEIYKAHQKIIFKFAHLFSRPGIEFDELFSIGNSVFMECMNRYNKEENNGACFTTFLYSQVKWRLLNAAVDYQKESMRMIQFRSGIDKNDNFEMSNNPNVSTWNPPCDNVETIGVDYSRCSDRLLRFKHAMKNLTDDASEVVWVALNSPTELIKDFPKLNKVAIRRYLLTLWKGENVQNRISDAFKEIGLALKNL